MFLFEKLLKTNDADLRQEIVFFKEALINDYGQANTDLWLGSRLVAEEAEVNNFLFPIGSHALVDGELKLISEGTIKNCTTAEQVNSRKVLVKKLAIDSFENSLGEVFPHEGRAATLYRLMLSEEFVTVYEVNGEWRLL
jgi:hypothetical protein